MTTILVTGSNGLLGQKLISALVERNRIDAQWNIIATARGENRLKLRDGYVFHSMDITNRDEIQSVFSTTMPDVVINTAAMTNVDICESKREEARLLNATSVKYMIDVLDELADKDPIINTHFIHLSTDFIFDGQDGPYTEEDKPLPLSYYGATKLEGEGIAKASHVRWSIIRTIIVYGIADDMSRSNLVLWAKGALEKGQKINVVDDQFRSPTLAEDLAEGCILCAEKQAEGIFNISGETTYSVLELVQKVANFWKLDAALINPVKSETIAQPAKRPPRTGFIIDKAKSVLGYKPHTFEEGLAILDKQLGQRV